MMHRLDAICDAVSDLENSSSVNSVIPPLIVLRAMLIKDIFWPHVRPHFVDAEAGKHPTAAPRTWASLRTFTFGSGAHTTQNLCDYVLEAIEHSDTQQRTRRKCECLA